MYIDLKIYIFYIQYINRYYSVHAASTETRHAVVVVQVELDKNKCSRCALLISLAILMGEGGLRIHIKETKPFYICENTSLEI